MTKQQTPSIEALQDELGYQFKDVSLLQYALTHKSAPAADMGHYERLEFLGDRVLGLEIATSLYHHFAKDDQGDLTKRFHALVRQDALVEVAKRLNLQNYMITSSTGEIKSKVSVLADVVEAIIAAIYLDGGQKPASQFIKAHLDITQTDPDAELENPKSALQEWALGKGYSLPVYHVLSTDGPAHAPVFTITVAVETIGQATAKGSSKKDAEKQAALQLMKIVKSGSKS